MRLLLAAFITLTPFAYSDEIVLQVSAKYVKHLGVPSDLSCENDEGVEEDDEEVLCWDFYTFHLYKGMVKRVVSGEYSESRIKFVISQHSQISNSYAKNMYIRVTKFEKPDWTKFSDTEYYAADFGFVDPVVCFDKELDKSFSKAVLLKNTDQVCYYEDEI